MKKKQVLILLLTLFLGAGTAAAQQIAIKTNALMLAAMTPNLECELVTGEHASASFVRVRAFQTPTALIQR